MREFIALYVFYRNRCRHDRLRALCNAIKTWV